MTNYVKATNFTSKDSLPGGDPLKIVKGSEIDTEFNAIATAVSSKANTTDVPTNAGSGATGTWAISISGTAATATNTASKTGTGSTYVTNTSPTITSPALVTPALGTPASGNLANCTFPTLNQNTTGNAATATTDSQHLGVGQTWQSVTRLSGTTYTNSTGKPIMVAANCYANFGVTVAVGGVTIMSGSNSNLTYPISFIVPNATDYVITCLAGLSVAELR